jgi:hypothetical protein
VSLRFRVSFPTVALGAVLAEYPPAPAGQSGAAALSAANAPLPAVSSQPRSHLGPIDGLGCFS